MLRKIMHIDPKPNDHTDIQPNPPPQPYPHHHQHQQHQHQHQHQHHSPQQKQPQSQLKEHSNLQLFLLTCGLTGIQFSWAVQIGYVTKSLLELGLSQTLVSYAWLAGPIAGIIIQPLVGILSDKCTHSLGRRRPFLIIGSLLTSIFLILFSYAQRIGRFFGDTSKDHSIALFIAIISFWSLDFSINAAQGPLRALLADLVPAKQHNQGNSFFALATGLGNLTGSLLGSVKLASFLPFFFTNDLEALYTVAVLILLITMSCTVISTKEVPLSPSFSMNGSPINRNDYDYNSVSNDSDDHTPTQHNDSSFLTAASKAPYPFWQLFTVQCFVWFGWFTLFVFATSWIGSEVYHGSYDYEEGSRPRELYDSGVRLGNLGLALQSVVTMITSPLLPTMIAKTSSQFIYFISNLLFGICLCSAWFITEKSMGWIACLMLALTGVNWAVTMTIPWSLMGESVTKFHPSRVGIYYTMFNLSQCFPEVMVSVVASEVIKITSKQVAVLGLGGLMVLIGSILIIILNVGPAGDKSTNADVTLNNRVRSRQFSKTEDVQVSIPLSSSDESSSR